MQIIMNFPKEIESTSNITSQTQAQYKLSSTLEIPSTNDVLLGRAANVFHHSGNRRYRHIITMNLHRYKECRNRLDKMILIKEIAEEILDNGAVRFLRRVNSTGIKNRWKEVPFRTVQDKVSHAMRDGINKTIFPTADPIKISVSAPVPSTPSDATNSITLPTPAATLPQSQQGEMRKSIMGERRWEQQRQRTTTTNKDEALLLQQQLRLLNVELSMSLLNAKSNITRRSLGTLLPFPPPTLTAANTAPVQAANSIKRPPSRLGRIASSLIRASTSSLPSGSSSKGSTAKSRPMIGSNKNIRVSNISQPQKTLGPSPLDSNVHDLLASSKGKQYTSTIVEKLSKTATEEESDVAQRKLVHDALQKYQAKYVANSDSNIR